MSLIATTLDELGVRARPPANADTNRAWKGGALMLLYALASNFTVRLGITPPAGPVLAPYLIQVFAAEVPKATVELHRMWLPNLIAALTSGEIDVGITCGIFPAPTGITTRIFCAERLLVG